MEMKAALPFREILAQAQQQKKSVALHLSSGTVLTGPVGDVGDHAVLLTSLSGKEFYDALVRIDEIAAIEVRVRTK